MNGDWSKKDEVTAVPRHEAKHCSGQRSRTARTGQVVAAGLHHISKAGFTFLVLLRNEVLRNIVY